MAKTKVKPLKLASRTSADVRKKIRFFYIEKYFNKWMSKFIFKGLNYQQTQFIMKKFWSVGTISAIDIVNLNKNIEELAKAGLVDMKENSLVFAPWTPGSTFNVYDFPTHARPINVRNVKFIPDKDLIVDKEIVIGWAQKNHKSVFSSIEAKIHEIVDTEMKKRTARKAQAQPWFFAFAPEDREQAKMLQEAIDNDCPYIFAPFEDPNRIKGIVSGAPYIVDKLEQDRQKCDNDILTMLGVNNVGVGEKKEHLIVDEVNANNEEVDTQAVAFESEVESFFDRIKTAFGVNIQVIDLNEVSSQDSQEPQEEEDDVDEQAN